MPAYEFQKRFVPAILSGRKPHTIRKRRQRPTKEGDTLVFYTGMRTKYCKFVAQTKCVKIEPLLIKPWKEEVWIWHPEEPGDLYYIEGEDVGSYRLMTQLEVRLLGYDDGFDHLSDFFDFFKRYKTDVLDNLELIWWDPKTLIGRDGSVLEVRDAK